MDTVQLAKRIFELVGGNENISSVTHCMTRLRLVVKDKAKIQHDELSGMPEVIKVMDFGGQYQIVLGAIVDDVYKEFLKLCDRAGGFGGRPESSVSGTEAKGPGERGKQKVMDNLIGTLSGIFTPLIPAMLGMSFLKVLCIILDVFFGVTDSNTTYAILMTLSDSFFYFLPMLVAWSAARRFETNIGVALIIIGLLLHPNFLKLLENSDVSFLGIPVTNVYYASSVLPAILSVYLLSKVEFLLKRIIPKALNSIMVPFISLLVVAPVTILVLGPIGNWTGTFITSIFTSLYQFSPILAGALIGGTWQILIIGGMHIVILSLVTVPNIATLGRDTVIVTHAPSLMCQYAAGLAVALKAKDPKVKKTAMTLTLTGFFGGSIVEPVMYGINLKYKKPFYFVLVGGAVGGAIAGGSLAGVTAPVALSIYSLPAYFGVGFTGLMIGAAVGSLITFVLTYLFGINEKVEVASSKGESAVPYTA
ncbi:PTS transporter subunit EIIC [Neobacillus sp. YIM B06451]|uniref:PTS transporter subunit EIIC n=1 Tax=Neobacillus sp. YIM B06451 TaxID=3070994 RepID=UPI002930421C|nr:PTS transporter subunit EIIC [Neobacillus sp. YIM B06451]